MRVLASIVKRIKIYKRSDCNSVEFRRKGLVSEVLTSFKICFEVAHYGLCEVSLPGPQPAQTPGIC